jgi:D-beta-D-heptose 7-phosphate kinase/D-beta-D-heptose 1-phosphate adenosyltransferase
MQKVLIIGDIIIDRYIYGTSTRLSPEAPVPVVNQERITETLGGAGLVYENLKNLGVDVDLYEHGELPSIKTRIICDKHYITRIDQDNFADGIAVLNKILSSDFSQYTYVILSDYNKGVLSESSSIIEHFNKFGCKIIVDPKKHINHYNGAWLIKPNHSEFEKFEFDSWQGNIVITQSEKNVIAKIDNKIYDIPVKSVEVSDVTGAGDCFLAAFVYALTKNYDHRKCLEIAVRGATVSVKHRGTYILTIEDLEDKIVFTNGVFDILHKGHLELLKKARSLGSKLIVGVNSDASVKRLKGNDRPINNELTRVEQLKILPWVDDVVVFHEDTPYETMLLLRPDIIVKGGDYTIDQVVGNNLAEVYIFPTIEGYSTTKIIEAAK